MIDPTTLKDTLADERRVGNRKTSAPRQQPVPDMHTALRALLSEGRDSGVLERKVK
jgi:hypothetical protein